MANELQAISVMLVFITVAIGLLIPAAWDELDNRIDNYQNSPEVRARTMATVRTLWLFKILPLLVLCTLVAYLITPRSVSIVAESRFAVWQFDLLATLFVLVAAMLWLAAVVVGYTLVRLLHRKRALDKYFAAK